MLYGVDSKASLEVQAFLAHVAGCGMGLWTAAEPLLSSVVALRGRALGPRHPATRAAAASLAELLLHYGSNQAVGQPGEGLCAECAESGGLIDAQTLQSYVSVGASEAALAAASRAAEGVRLAGFCAAQPFPLRRMHSAGGARRAWGASGGPGLRGRAHEWHCCVGSRAQQALAGALAKGNVRHGAVSAMAGERAQLGARGAQQGNDADAGASLALRGLEDSTSITGCGDVAGK
ncbi:hypothetical protein GPECTOR_136g632 [Gonium pectorale]|uniref:Uncharacterized protein n=1 Tax=Gonium pectorale TaxID=33097 RepID=A0A150FY72_GONPE|nr:hypothetical protein GPECTOR_136g632 [Gonium pectorale]|eukprot:KXZ42549.1 hypothetical protein GPECTOR_136g632 [Gonium pectorale]